MCVSSGIQSTFSHRTRSKIVRPTSPAGHVTITNHLPVVLMGTTKHCYVNITWGWGGQKLKRLQVDISY